jgi:ribosomal protein L7/L12
MTSKASRIFFERLVEAAGDHEGIDTTDDLHAALINELRETLGIDSARFALFIRDWQDFKISAIKAARTVRRELGLMVRLRECKDLVEKSYPVAVNLTMEEAVKFKAQFDSEACRYSSGTSPTVEIREGKDFPTIEDHERAPNPANRPNQWQVPY